MKKVFLGGTCNESKWRDDLIPMLKIDSFNPVVDDWNEESQAEEERQKKACDFCLFVITPKMTGVYAIAEVTQLSITRPQATIFCVLDEDDGIEFTESQHHSLNAVANLIENNNAKVFDNLVCVAEHLNKSYVEIAYNVNVIQCKIERDGPTEMNIGKASYLFKKNELGDYACEVLSSEHRKHLLSIPGFNVYQSNLAPEKAFSGTEEEFVVQWRFLRTPDFLAFVNGHIDEINNMSAKARNLARIKWLKLLPDQGCPIYHEYVEDNIKPQDTPPAIIPDEPIEMIELNKNPEDEMTAFDHGFWKKWMNMGAQRFKDYVEKNNQAFLDSPEFLWDKAETKWKRLLTDKTGEIWPFYDPEDEKDKKDDG